MGMKVAIGVGLMEFPFENAREYWQWVDLCENEGIDSIWQTDRITSRQPNLEALTAMAALAGGTRRILFGMNVIALALRDPVLVAKQIATIDVLSEGRILPAFGIGSQFSPDWGAVGVSPEGRGNRTDEALEIIKRLWSGEQFDFKGEYYELEGVRISPTPIQEKIPLWIGGSSKAAIRRTARIGTGWLGGRETPAEAGRVVERVREIAKSYDRKVPEDHYGGAFYYRFGSPDEAFVADRVQALKRRFPDRDPLDSIVVGNADDIAERVQAYVDVGVTKFVLRPLAVGIEEYCDQTHRLANEVIPRF